MRQRKARMDAEAEERRAVREADEAARAAHKERLRTQLTAERDAQQRQTEERQACERARDAELAAAAAAEAQRAALQRERTLAAERRRLQEELKEKRLLL
jgi:hypothetical protein